jgi:hypothetical protein
MSTHEFTEYDLESPKSVDLSSPASPKEDDNHSVATHQSDSESESDASHYNDPRNGRSFRKLLLVALLAAVLGLTIGLGVGMGMGGKEASRSVAPASNGAENNMAENLVVDEPAADNSTVEESSTPTDEQPQQDTPPEEENKAPAFGGIGLGGSGASQNLKFPELLGLPAEEAKQIIEDKDEGYFVVIVPPGGSTTKDLRHDRVFLFTNEEGRVARVPSTGR